MDEDWADKLFVLCILPAEGRTDTTAGIGDLGLSSNSSHSTFSNRSSDDFSYSGYNFMGDDDSFQMDKDQTTVQQNYGGYNYMSDDDSFQMDVDQTTLHQRVNLVCYSDTESSVSSSTSAESITPTSGTTVVLAPHQQPSLGGTSESRK